MKQSILLFTFFLAALSSCKKDSKTETVPYPTDGLNSYFNLNDNLKDKQDYMADGVPEADPVLGNPVFATGKLGKALYLEAKQRVKFTVNTPESRSNVSIACWFNTSQASTEPFITLRTSTNHEIILTTFNLEYLSFLIIANSAVFTNALVPKGVWTHLVATYDGTDSKIYINGVLIETKNTPTTISGTDMHLYLGYTQNNWTGYIDELYIYNRAITQAEVTQLYNLN